MWLYAGVLTLALVVGIALAIAVFGLSRAGDDAVKRLGSPTPDSARVEVEKSKAAEKTKEATDAIRKDSLDGLVDRARSMRDRGREPPRGR